MAANDRCGFTLLELLLALAIAALVLAAAYTTLFSLTQAQERATKSMEQRRALRTTLDRLRCELSSIVYRNNNPQLRFIVQDRDYFGKPASAMQYATIAPPGDSNTADLQRARYRILEESNGRLVLHRASQGLFAVQERTDDGYPLLHGLEGFLVECFDGGKWVTTWDTNLTPALPKMIRVTVKQHEGERVVSYQATVAPRITAP